MPSNAGSTPRIRTTISFPSPGKITLLLAPSGPGIRRDSGMYEGWTVPIDYDPLLAKLIGYGTDREQATARLVRALNEYFVGGIKTNISLFRTNSERPGFSGGKTRYGVPGPAVERKEDEGSVDARKGAEVAAIAAGLFAVLDPGEPRPASRSERATGCGRLHNGSGRDAKKGCARDATFMTYDVVIDGKNYRLELARVEVDWECRLMGTRWSVDAVMPRRDVLSIIVRREILRDQARADRHRPSFVGWSPCVTQSDCAIRVRCAAARRPELPVKGPRKLLAPMPGKVVRVMLSEGDEVEAGQGVRGRGSDEDAERDQVAEEGRRCERWWPRKAPT